MTVIISVLIIMFIVLQLIFHDIITSVLFTFFVFEIFGIIDTWNNFDDKNDDDELKGKNKDGDN